jgi:hypothetical protein
MHAIASFMTGEYFLLYIRGGLYEIRLFADVVKKIQHFFGCHNLSLAKNIT